METRLGVPLTSRPEALKRVIGVAKQMESIRRVVNLGARDAMARQITDTAVQMLPSDVRHVFDDDALYVVPKSSASEPFIVYGPFTVLKAGVSGWVIQASHPVTGELGGDPIHLALSVVEKMVQVGVLYLYAFPLDLAFQPKTDVTGMDLVAIPARTLLSTAGALVNPTIFMSDAPGSKLMDGPAYWIPGVHTTLRGNSVLLFQKHNADSGTVEFQYLDVDLKDSFKYKVPKEEAAAVRSQVLALV